MEWLIVRQGVQKNDHKGAENQDTLVMEWLIVRQGVQQNDHKVRKTRHLGGESFDFSPRSYSFGVLKSSGEASG